MTDHSPAHDDHRAAVELAELAGAELLRVRATLAADGVSGSDLKDAGDAAAQAVLARALGQRFPGDAVLSEEAAEDPRRRTAGRVWIIDPLDGTREFSEAGRDDWAVHVALWVRTGPEAAAPEAVGDRASRGELTAGAVALPVRGVTHSTSGARPAYQPIGDRPLRLAVSRSRPPAFVTELAGVLGAELVPMGSAGVKAMSVVTGECDAYVHGGGQYEWDSAAPVAVARAAGLATSRLDGSPLTYNNTDPWLPDVIVCRPEIRPTLLSEIARLSV